MIRWTFLVAATISFAGAVLTSHAAHRDKQQASPGSAATKAAARQ
ncbi:hypothetical protein [Novosphingobium sp. CF614]|nr:hypothetical protein [Novosphingobium sp. CF614]